MRAKPILLLALVVVITLSCAHVCIAQPPIPHAFYGSLRVYGLGGTVDALPGVVVEAIVNENVCGSITTTEAGKYGGPEALDPKLVVQGDIDDGTTIYFYVNDVKSDNTWPFKSGDVTLLNLTVEDNVPPSVPTGVIRTTPGNDNTPTFSWTASIDALAGVDHYEVRVDPDNWTSIGNVTSWTSLTVSEGSHTFYVRAVDRVNNVGAPASLPFSIDMVAPTISGIAVSEITSTGATITWTTDEPATSQVEYGTTSAYGYTTTLITLTTSHSVRLGGLIPSTTYHYRVRSADAATNLSVSEDNTFTTAAPAPPPPAKATLTVDTTPIRASVYVDGSLWGIAPQMRELDAGTYAVSFGDVLGFITPASETVTLAEGETRTVTGVYTEISPEIIENVSPTYEIPSITPEENATVDVENTAITELTICVKNAVENVRVTVQQFTERPAGIEIAAPGISYKYLNIVAQNITDADIDVILINFSVERAWITAENIDPDTISLRKWVAGAWVSLPTAKVGEDDTYFYYSAESPGLSIFAVSGSVPAPAEFVLSDLVIEPMEVGPGENVEISVNVTNVGDLEGTYTVTLNIGDLVEATKNVTLAGGATQTVTFTVSRDVEGTHNVEVDGLMGTFVVTAPPALPPVVPLAITVTVIVLVIFLIWLRRVKPRIGTRVIGALGYAIHWYRERIKWVRVREKQRSRMRRLKKITGGK